MSRDAKRELYGFLAFIGCVILVIAVILGGALGFTALMNASSDNGKWSGPNCTTQGNTSVCVINRKDGKTCQSTIERFAFKSDLQTTNCTSSTKMKCSQSVNTSGNVCRVPVGGGQYCVAVLPDGGKDPRYKPDYVTCPNKDDVKSATKNANKALDKS